MDSVPAFDGADPGVRNAITMTRLLVLLHDLNLIYFSKFYNIDIIIHYDTMVRKKLEASVVFIGR